MLDCVTWATAHLFGSALAEQHRLRYRVFVKRAGWNVPHINEMEWDQYDTPAAHYLIWRDPEGVARGVVRASPTDIPYMIADIWPELVTEEELPRSAEVWECTRLAVDPTAPAALRREIRNELVVGMIEFGVARSITRFLHLTPMAFVRSIFWGNDFNTGLIGGPSPIDGIACGVCATECSAQALETVRAATGISAPVIRWPDDVAVRTEAA